MIRAFTYYAVLTRRWHWRDGSGVLAGALLVGESVRGRLRDLVLHRLGRTDQVVVSTGFFRDALADELRADEAFSGSFASIAPMIVVEGVVGDQTSGRRVPRVAVYGVDERFWRFHGVAVSNWESASERRETLLSAALAEDIGAKAGGTVLVRVARPSAVPIESLQGRKDDRVDARFRFARSPARPTWVFSPGPSRAECAPCSCLFAALQQELALDGRVNTLPSQHVEPAAALHARHWRRWSGGVTMPEDPGVTLRSDRGVACGGRRERRRSAGRRASGGGGAGLPPRWRSNRTVCTYLANTLKSGDREVPYSLITAIDLAAIAGLEKANDERPPIVLNDWTARDLHARTGDPLTRYAVWRRPGVWSAGGRVSNCRRRARCRDSPPTVPSRRYIPD